LIFLQSRQLTGKVYNNENVKISDKNNFKMCNVSRPRNCSVSSFSFSWHKL